MESLLLVLDAKVGLLELEFTVDQVVEDVSHALHQTVERHLVLVLGAALGTIVLSGFGLGELGLEGGLESEESAQKLTEIEIDSEVVESDETLDGLCCLGGGLFTSLRNFSTCPTIILYSRLYWLSMSAVGKNSPSPSSLEEKLAVSMLWFIAI